MKQCLKCQFYNESIDIMSQSDAVVEGAPEVHYCFSFPEGIPAEIWEGRNDHTKPYPGDNGITFIPRE